MITPWLQLYNKPKAQAINGLGFIKRFRAFSYKHTIDAMGWFDSMRCTLSLSRKEAESFMLNYLGNEVRIYVDNPNRIVWEGFINRITLKRSGIVTTRSLDPMTNRVQVQYDDPSVTPQSLRTAQVNDADSIAIYGSKSAVYEAGTNRGAETLTTGIGDKKLAELAWPSFSSVQDTSGGISLEIECLGFYHTISWDKYEITNTTVEAVGLVIARYLYGTTSPTYVGWNSSVTAGGTGVFYNDTDSDAWNANTSYNANRELRGKTVWDHIVRMCEAGDGSNDWLAGLEPTDSSRGYRRAYYRQANTEVRYIVRLADKMRIRNVWGGLVNPWDVTPDCSIRVADLLTNGRIDAATESDPREMWIKRIDYDGNSNSVTWQGKDDITIEGVFGFKDTIDDLGGKFAKERTSYV